jgi:hypothetical protein
VTAEDAESPALTDGRCRTLAPLFDGLTLIKILRWQHILNRRPQAEELRQREWPTLAS